MGTQIRDWICVTVLGTASIQQDVCCAPRFPQSGLLPGSSTVCRGHWWYWQVSSQELASWVLL